jgi:hypothetical protein
MHCWGAVDQKYSHGNKIPRKKIPLNHKNVYFNKNIVLYASEFRASRMDFVKEGFIQTFYNFM